MLHVDNCSAYLDLSCHHRPVSNLGRCLIDQGGCLIYCRCIGVLYLKLASDTVIRWSTLGHHTNYLSTVWHFDNTFFLHLNISSFLFIEQTSKFNIIHLMIDKLLLNDLVDIFAPKSRQGFLN